MTFIVWPWTASIVRPWVAFCGSICLMALVGCADVDREKVGDPPSALTEASVEAQLAVETLPLERREVVEWIYLPADLWPVRRAVLAAEVAGRVDALSVDEGDQVQRGQTLAAIDCAALEQQVAEAEALHRQSLITFDRAEKLIAKRAITQPQLLEALTGRDVAAARLATAQLQLEKSQVVAPWAGTVAERRVEIGDFAQIGQPLFELLDVRTLEARAPVPARDVPFLVEGARATVRVEGLDPNLFEGRVKRLATALDPKTRTLDIEIEIDNPVQRLRPGMSARIELPRQTLANALLVPLTSLIEFEDAQAVYVVEDGRAQRRFVALGTVIGDEVVVEDGLDEDDLLIVKGQNRVSDGQRVHAVSESGASR